MDNFDVIIIGAGPGGYVTAIRAAQLGFNTCIIENKHLGGICLNWGCIPTKALLRSAEVFHLTKNADTFGISSKETNFDLKRIVERSRDISKQLNQGVGYLLKKNKVSVFKGTARLNGPGKIEVSANDKKTKLLSSPHIIIATGARPRTLTQFKLNKNLLWTYFEAMVPKKIPQSLIVIGSGAIGVEFASFYCALGADVTILEILPQILPNEDPEIAAIARKQMELYGIKIITEATIKNVKKKDDHVTLDIETKNNQTKELTVDRIISAIGVQGNIENLGLETTKVKTEKNCIRTDSFGLTNEPGIFAIGDVAGPPMLAHKAEHEGVICIEKIAGMEVDPLQPNKIPNCTYSFPQISSVGLTENNAVNAGYSVRVGRFPFIGNGKAIALGEPDGLVKTIFDANTGELLGAHMVGADVTELIHGFVIAMGLETTEKELMDTIFPHPTLSEMMHESVLDAYQQVIHI